MRGFVRRHLTKPGSVWHGHARSHGTCTKLTVDLVREILGRAEHGESRASIQSRLRLFEGHRVRCPPWPRVARHLSRGAATRVAVARDAAAWLKRAGQLDGGTAAGGGRGGATCRRRDEERRHHARYSPRLAIFATLLMLPPADPGVTSSLSVVNMVSPFGAVPLVRMSRLHGRVKSNIHAAA